MKKLMLGFVLVVGLVLGMSGCATTPHEIYHIGDTVTVGSFRVELRSVDFASTYYVNWVNQTKYGNFFITDVIFTNLTGNPLPMHFQPVSGLIDSNGSKYAPSQQDTMMINMNKPGRVNPGGAWNPNIAIEQENVFVVPQDKKYYLRIIAPSSAHVGFAGGIDVSGPYALFDLSPSPKYK